MRKLYLTPKLRVKDLWFDVNFLNSIVDIGASSGENLYDPEEFDPWS